MTQLSVLRHLWDHCGGIPQDYLCIDLETSGFVFNSRKSDPAARESGADLIWETGHCEVRQGQAQEYCWTALNWIGHPYVEEDFLRSRLYRLQQAMARDGRTCHMSWSRMEQEGEDPEETLYAFYNLLMDAREAGRKIVGHNVILFESRVLQDAFHEWIGVDFAFAPDELIDTAAIEKALITGYLPFQEETLQEYFRRLLHAHTAGERWNIDHCIQKYQLVEKYGLDPRQTHNAGFDAMVTHLLLEEFRELTEADEEETA